MFVKEFEDSITKLFNLQKGLSSKTRLLSFAACVVMKWPLHNATEVDDLQPNTSMQCISIYSSSQPHDGTRPLSHQFYCKSVGFLLNICYYHLFFWSKVRYPNETFRNMVQCTSHKQDCNILYCRSTLISKAFPSAYQTSKKLVWTWSVLQPQLFVVVILYLQNGCIPLWKLVSACPLYKDCPLCMLLAYGYDSHLKQEENYWNDIKVERNNFSLFFCSGTGRLDLNTDVKDQSFAF